MSRDRYRRYMKDYRITDKDIKDIRDNSPYIIPTDALANGWTQTAIRQVLGHSVCGADKSVLALLKNKIEPWLIALEKKIDAQTTIGKVEWLDTKKIDHRTQIITTPLNGKGLYVIRLKHAEPLVSYSFFKWGDTVTTSKGVFFDEVLQEHFNITRIEYNEDNVVVNLENIGYYNVGSSDINSRIDNPKWYIDKIGYIGEKNE